jgi:hypothetical protein
VPFSGDSFAARREVNAMRCNDFTVFLGGDEDEDGSNNGHE